MKYAVMEFAGFARQGEALTRMEPRAWSTDREKALDWLRHAEEDGDPLAVMEVSDGFIADFDPGRDLDLAYDPRFDIEEALRNTVQFGIDGGIDISDNSEADGTVGDARCPRITSRTWQGVEDLHVAFEDGRAYVVSVHVRPAPRAG